MNGLSCDKAVRVKREVIGWVDYKAEWAWRVVQQSRERSPAANGCGVSGFREQLGVRGEK
jgi:hypothetical protein